MKKRVYYGSAMGIGMACLLLSTGLVQAQTAPCGDGRELPNATWYMTAPPCTPDPLGVDAQLGDDIAGAYDTTWISFTWDATSQAYVQQAAAGELVLGYGNWTYSVGGASCTMVIDGTETPVVDCTTFGLAQNCYPIDLVLPAAGSTAWNMIGNPFTYTVPWADVRIAALVGSTWTAYTPTNAEANGYVQKTAQRYTIAQSYEPFEDGGASPGTLQVQESVWVRSMDPAGHSATALKLLIPAQSTGNPAPCNGAEVSNVGQTWLACNLGATQVATASNDSLAYGDLYQWGRLRDGHQLRTSGTTGTQSSGNVPGHNNFITGNPDWRASQNDTLWQGLTGINNPCPSGFRLPSATELESERQS